MQIKSRVNAINLNIHKFYGLWVSKYFHLFQYISDFIKSIVGIFQICLYIWIYGNEV